MFMNQKYNLVTKSPHPVGVFNSSLYWYGLSSENIAIHGDAEGVLGGRSTRGRGRDPKDCVVILGLGGVGRFQEAWGNIRRNGGIPRGIWRS